MTELRLVERDEIALFWPALKPYFARIPAKIETPITPDNILARAKDRRLLLYAIHDDGKLLGAAATGFIEETRTAFVEAIAGDDMARWLAPIVDQYEDCAKRAQAFTIRVRGRKGWLRKLRKFGYRPVSDDAAEKRLGHG